MTITAAFTMENPAGVSALVITQVKALAQVAIDAWGAVLAGNSTTSVTITIAETTPSGRAQGGNETSRYLGTFAGNNVFEPGAAYELRTGLEMTQVGADIHITFARDYLLNELFLDASPLTGNDIPVDKTDALSVLLHEIGHALGFIGYYNETQNSFIARTPYDAHVVLRGGEAYFDGSNVRNVYGRAIALTDNNYAHYGNSSADPRTISDPLTGLMNGVVYYRGYRYSIGEIDLAVMADNGVGTIRNDHFNIGLMRAFNGGTGIDTVAFPQTTAGVSLSLAVETEQATGGAGAVTLVNIENLEGSGFGDTLAGSRFVNRIDGGAGADSINGGASGDTLIGGRGRDILTGGAGSDVFIFEKGDTAKNARAADTVTDFIQAQHDRIDLTAIDAVAGNASVDAFSFVRESAFSGTAGELRYEFSGGDTLISGDVNGDGRADLTLRLTGQIALLADDFILVSPARLAIEPTAVIEDLSRPFAFDRTLPILGMIHEMLL